jgi:DNA-binding LytR/AlgR family response regulator
MLLSDGENRSMYILIAEDETPVRAELRYLLEQLIPDAVFYEAANGEQALRIVEHENIQVAFLDIRMPGIDGLTVAAILIESPQPPIIVFATAYEEHALQAFELAALDYVLKPFDEQRLAHTFSRIRQAFAERTALTQMRAGLQTYLDQVAPATSLTKLWAERANGSWALVDYKDVMWAEAEDKKVYVHIPSETELLTRFALKDLEERLHPHGFVRVHRSFLINLDYIADVEPSFSGTFTICMKDEEHTRISLSRGYAANLRNLPGWKE